MNEIVINGINDLPRAAGEFLDKIGDSRIIAFYGRMGAGKTTFTTAVCRRLGVEDSVGSPTFTIVNEYRSASGEPVFHFDFYRIKDLREAVDIGIWEYFDSGSLCLIEWPEMIGDLLPGDALKVRIETVDENTRKITF